MNGKFPIIFCSTIFKKFDWFHRSPNKPPIFLCVSTENKLAGKLLVENRRLFSISQGSEDTSDFSQRKVFPAQ